MVSPEWNSVYVSLERNQIGKLSQRVVCLHVVNYVAKSHIKTVSGNSPKCIRRPSLVRAWLDRWGQTWRFCKCRDGCWTLQCLGPCTLYLKNKTFSNLSSELQFIINLERQQTVWVFACDVIRSFISMQWPSNPSPSQLINQSSLHWCILVVSIDLFLLSKSCFCSNGVY